MNGGGEHLGDRLSALLDGEVAPTEQAAAEDHLRGCPACRAEHDAVASVRSAVRSLPRIDPPAGSLDRWLRTGDGPRRSLRRSRALAGVAATAALWAALLVGGAALEDPRLAPAVGAFAAGHSEAVEGTLPAQRQPAGDLPTPARLAGDYLLETVVSRNGAIQLVYDHGGSQVSIFEQWGDLDWSALPASGQRVSTGVLTAWRSTTTSLEVVVFERGAMVVTVVSDEPVEEMLAMAESLPEPERSVLDRVRRGCRSVVERFALQP